MFLGISKDKTFQEWAQMIQKAKKQILSGQYIIW